MPCFWAMPCSQRAVRVKMVRRVQVPNTLLAAGKMYEFTLTLSNFLGFSAVSSPLVVAVSAGSIPNLLIVGGATQRGLAPNPLGLFAQASVAVCPGGKAGSTTLSYRWRCTTYASAVSTSVDPRFFKLPACVPLFSSRVLSFVSRTRRHSRAAATEVHVPSCGVVY